MYYLIFITLLTFPAISFVSCVPSDILLKSAEIIREVNNDPHSTWKAYSYGYDEIDTEEFVRTKLGLKMDPEEEALQEEMKKVAAEQSKNILILPASENEIPINFTWTDKKNTNCSIDYIMDQSNCGSCWAISSASAISDRFCIQSKGKVAVSLSAGYVMSCDKNNYGCNGGYMSYAYTFYKNNGSITGGDYDSDEGCQTYPIRPCGILDKMPCVWPESRTPFCRGKKCNNDWYKYASEPDNNVYKIQSYKYIWSYSYSTNEYLIRKEIFENGPVTAGMIVYQDLPYYKSGVYSPRSLYYMGLHAVRIVGWGVQNDIKYWLVANSWGRRWGDNGYFKILRGVNSCYIEGSVIAATPLI